MRRWFGNACTQAGLGWTPDTFWRATVAEYLAACDSHNRINRGGKEPMGREEFEELIERYPDRGSIRKKQ